MTERREAPRRRLLGMIGALWARHQRPSTNDACPPDTALAALIDGALSPAQAAGVRAHLTHCPQCYRKLLHWTEVADIAGRAATTTQGSSRGLITLFGGLGAAAAALLAVTTLLLDEPSWAERLGDPYASLDSAIRTGRYQPSLTGWVWRQGYATRSLAGPDTPRSAAARAGLTKGVARGLEAVVASEPAWQALRGELAGAEAACGDLLAAECARVTRFYEDVGRWAVLMHFACEPLQSDAASAAVDQAWPAPTFWHDAVQILAAIAEDSAMLTPQDSYSRLFANWSERADADTPATLCRGVPPLLSTLNL